MVSKASEDFPYPPIVIMICILLFYVILGMFMDAIGMLLLTLPVVYPAVGPVQRVFRPAATRKISSSRSLTASSRDFSR